MGKKIQSASWSFLGLLAIVNLLHYANRNVVVHARVFEDLREAFSATQAEIGLLGTAFMLPHALATLPVAWLGDRFDRQRVLAIGLLAWSAAGVLSALSWSMESLLLSRVVVGAGTAACVPMANALICQLIPADRQARTIGIYNLGLFLGGVVGVGAGALLGFPIAFMAVAAPGLLFSVFLWLHLFAPKQDASLHSPARPSQTGQQHPRWLASFIRDCRAIGSVAPLRTMMAGAILMAFAAGGYVHWFIEFLITEVGMSNAGANGLFVVAIIGGVLGVVSGGFVADLWLRHHRGGRQLAISCGVGVSAACAVALLNLAPGLLFSAVAFLLMFFISWYHGPIAAAVDDLVPNSRAATAQGTYIALMHLLGTAPSSYVVGLVADATDLRFAMYVPTAAMAMAALVFAIAARRVALHHRMILGQS